MERRPRRRQEWRGVQFLGQSYDNTGELGADTWRHVAFIEQKRPGDEGFRWLMSSDVCKHCTSAACLEVCPTGSLVRTEFGTVVVQEDICNGCGYCVPACPFGVIDQRESDGRVWKCTMCYDRLRGGLQPACATACPTKSIQFGPLDELRTRAAARVDTLHAAGTTEARLYGADPDDGVGGMGAFFLLLDDPEVYRLPPDPVVTTRDLPGMWRSAAAAAATLAVGVAAAFLGRRPMTPRSRNCRPADDARRCGRTTGGPCSSGRCGSGTSRPTSSRGASPGGPPCWPPGDG